MGQQRLPIPLDPVQCDDGTVDSCAYLFQACRDLQHACAAHGLEILFDVEPTKLPAATCDVIVLMLRAVVDDVIASSRSVLPGSSVTLELRHRGDIHALMIADRGFRSYAGGCTFAPLPIEMLAARLKAEWRVSATADRRIIAVAFGAWHARPSVDRRRNPAQITARRAHVP